MDALIRALPVISGILLLLAYPPFDQAVLAWFSLVPLLWRVFLAEQVDGVKVYGRPVRLSLVGGLIWGAGIFYPLLWIEEGEWIERVGGFLILGLLTASMLGFFCAAARWIWQALSPRRRWYAIFLFPSLWVVLEYLIRAVAAGFSTYLGVTQWKVPAMLAVASLGGVYAVSWLIVAVNAAIALSVWTRTGRLTGALARGGYAGHVYRPGLAGSFQRKTRRRVHLRWLPVALGVGALVTLVAAGQVGPPRFDAGPAKFVRPAAPVGSVGSLAGGAGLTESSEAAAGINPGVHSNLFRFVLVQPNITPAEYRMARSGIDVQRQLWERVLDQTETVAANQEAVAATASPPRPVETLVVLPETFVHYWAADDPAFRSRFTGFAAEWGIHWLVGLPRLVDEAPGEAVAPEQRNAALFIGRNGVLQSVYDKIYVIPVAEAHFSPGSELGLLDLGGHLLGIGICSDVVVPDHALATVRAGATSLHYMASLAHIGAIAKLERAFVVFRAAEHGVYVTQTATTGPTMVVDPKGRIVAELRSGEPGEIIVDLELRRSDPTLYTRLGDWVVLISGLLVVGHGVVGSGRAVGPGARVGSPTKGFAYR